MSHELAFQPHKLFQFTHPGGVRPRVQACVNTTQLMFQFTHPGGVRLDKSPLMLLLCRVSIHAPGRGATAKRVLATAEEDVSIHAPGRGATYKFKGAPVSDLKFQFTHPGGVRPRPRSHERRPSLRFNSRTREGCDGIQTSTPSARSVSIHAPGRGATRVCPHALITNHRFNSRTREGCDQRATSTS